MKRANHKSIVDARQELILAGYTLAHSYPHEPELWARPGTRRFVAIGREDRKRRPCWHIVSFERGVV